MAILFVADRATSDSFAFAVGSDALVVDSMPNLMRAVDEHPDEMLVVVGPDVDLGSALQLLPQRTVGDAAAMAGSMDVTGAQSLLTAHSPGLWAVLAPVNPGDAEKIPATVVAELIRTLKRMFEYVVIDTPPAFTEHV